MLIKVLKILEPDSTFAVVRICESSFIISEGDLPNLLNNYYSNSVIEL